MAMSPNDAKTISIAVPVKGDWPALSVIAMRRSGRRRREKRTRRGPPHRSAALNHLGCMPANLITLPRLAGKDGVTTRTKGLAPVNATGAMSSRKLKFGSCIALH
jgi:hypothetical protein